MKQPWLVCWFIGITEISVLTITFLAQPVMAGSEQTGQQVYMYRYQDANGNKIVAQQIPAESYQYGYDALDMRGRVLFSVSPALTEEQRKEKREQKLREERSRALLKAYSKPEDAVRAKERKLQQLDVTIEITEGKINQLRIQYEHLLELAADHEKKGRIVSDRILKDLTNYEAQIENLASFITTKEEEKSKITQKYDEIIAQLLDIIGEVQTETDTQPALSDSHGF